MAGGVRLTDAVRFHRKTLPVQPGTIYAVDVSYYVIFQDGTFFLIDDRGYRNQGVYYG